MSDIGVRESVDSLISEPSAEVAVLARRRRFSASYKRRILDEVDRTGRGEIGLILRREGIAREQLTVHADRGSSTRSKPAAFLLSDLGVTKTYSRPYTSTDNPYSEAQFRTLKYQPDFPERFGSLEDARVFSRRFFAWYNYGHRHSGIGLVTPAQRHSGQDKLVYDRRQAILEEFYREHPERFMRGMPSPPELPGEVWINKPNEERKVA